MRANAWHAGARVLIGASAWWVLGACGGGGGGGAPSSSGDPIITLQGPTGRLSRLIDEANDDNGATPLPTLPSSVTTTNHWIRLEFPTTIRRSDVLENSPLTAPFSYLNGSITINDLDGAHLPGVAMVNGVDAFGVNRSNDANFPHDVQGGVDLNLGENVFLYVADVDRNLSTFATFGFRFVSPNNSYQEISSASNHENGALDAVRVTVATIGGINYNGVFSVTVGDTVDLRRPFVVRASAEVQSPLDLGNKSSAAVTSSFLVEFSEPVVPLSVGESPAFNALGFGGNVPGTPRFLSGTDALGNPFTVPNYPYPNVALTTLVSVAVGSIYVPFDCQPVSENNLATYRMRPLISLPANTPIDVVVRSLTVNTNLFNGVASSVIDLSGNGFDGQDANNDGAPDQVDFSRTFTTGPGPGLVNIPVSPEVLYWLPSGVDGIGALDLNGRGLTTNTPGANLDDRFKSVMVTKAWLDPNGCEINPGGLNLANGIALWGYPGNDPTPTDPCTLLPMIEFGHNRFYYPFGLGSRPYGPIANQNYSGEDRQWHANLDPGNPGTPIPGVNEGSSGFETLCRDSNGDVVLTGRQFGSVGTIEDMVVGDFLDLVYFDQMSPTKTSTQLHVTIWNSPGPHSLTGRGNTICDPPTPNPPPLRYWLGMPEVGTVTDYINPENPAILIEGEEVFTGPRSAMGYFSIEPNSVRPDAHDVPVFPQIGHGPNPQSATVSVTYSSRQQIGNFLYAADATVGVVHAINSNTMRVIASISTPDPTGLAIAPDMSKLYVSNFGFNSVSIIGANPLAPDFHQEIAQINVGNGPRAICVQPENEEILVCNYLGNTVSLISEIDLSVRKTIDALISGPYDIEASPRQIQPFSPSPLAPTTIGWACGLYFAYVSNFTGNSVIVYESGPDGPQGIGIDGVRGSLPTDDDTVNEIFEPRGLCYDPFPDPAGLYAGGCFIAHRDSEGRGRVTEIQFTQQAQFGPLPVNAPPGLQTPPGFLGRVFEIVRTWGNTDVGRLIGESPSDVALSDLNVAGWHGNPTQGTGSVAPNVACTSTPPEVEKTGFINSKHPMRLSVPACYAAVVPDRLYVSFDDIGAIQVLNPLQPGLILNTITEPTVQGIRKLGSYWRQ
ncbi:MAG: YncE family protein [Planctomycetes bacterium]|nr:YncE family protein [Planctomycetota bacterium]